MFLYLRNDAAFKCVWQQVSCLTLLFCFLFVFFFAIKGIPLSLIDHRQHTNINTYIEPLVDFESWYLNRFYSLQLIVWKINRHMQRINRNAMYYYWIFYLVQRICQTNYFKYKIVLVVSPITNTIYQLQQASKPLNIYCDSFKILSNSVLIDLNEKLKIIILKNQRKMIFFL